MWFATVFLSNEQMLKKESLGFSKLFKTYTVIWLLGNEGSPLRTVKRSIHEDRSVRNANKGQPSPPNSLLSRKC
ncbi:hypothetical protein CHUAL_004624 [Chamberlinius hualienensis]